MHYADSHHGCCMEFELTRQHNTQWNVMHVKYAEELPKISADTRESISNIVSVKHPLWVDVNEVRAVRQYGVEKIR